MEQHNTTKQQLINVAPWLLTKDEYVPLKDKERFLKKTLLEIIGKLSALKQTSNLNSKLSIPLHLLSALILILLIVASPKLNFPIFVLIGFIFYLAFQSGTKIISILKPACIASIFTLCIVLPSIFLGNQGILFLPIKVFITVIVLSYLTRNIPVNKLISSLGYFKIPNIIILILNLTINYIVILGNTTLDLLQALRLRSVGKNNSKYHSLAGIVGITFLKSEKYAQDTYGAMLCRGFTGKYQHKYKLKLNFIFFYYLIFWLIIFLLYGLCLKN